MGITWEQFWRMNPAIVKAHIKGAKREIEIQNNLMHLNGAYTTEALRSTVGNMFNKKGAKPHQYPDKPFELSGLKEEQNKVLTDEEKENQVSSLFRRLELMQSNFNLSHGKKEE